ncbi:unnamed protein product [Didymodactylos carnosus]|uniref:DegV family protein n=1 Tax=Didymodactylos carnosus TaxID=1234261 RepID=A0A8S2H1K7_9BILA|nr:unnamed protein product [Didymodactylos carnosus]CAF3581100.1 unnamed protein product [Didymodactylos carnosus]
MKKVAVIVDSSIDLSKQEAEALGFHYVPLEIVVDSNQVYRDSVDIDKAQLLKLLATNASIKTMQSNVGTMQEMVENLLSTYDFVLVIPIASSLSAQDLTELIKNGGTLKQAESYTAARQTKRMAILRTVDIDRLAKGGRISLIKGMLAKLLKINILISFRGALAFVDKAKDKKQSISKMRQHLYSDLKINNSKQVRRACFLEYFDNEHQQEREEIFGLIQNEFNDLKFERTVIPNILACHLGRNSFSIYLELY